MLAHREAEAVFAYREATALCLPAHIVKNHRHFKGRLHGVRTAAHGTQCPGLPSNIISSQLVSWPSSTQAPNPESLESKQTSDQNRHHTEARSQIYRSLFMRCRYHCYSLDHTLHSTRRVHVTFNLQCIQPLPIHSQIRLLQARVHHEH